MADIPSGKYIGTDANGIATSEADHHMKCPGQRFDMRDLGQVAEHQHDAEIEIIEGSPPRAAVTN
ncbi:hypothetical protein ACFIOY_29555 [Bradyrhizobium sp. TZ2]